MAKIKTIYQKAKETILDNMRLLSTRRLRQLSDKELRKLWREVNNNTCDILQGYHSDGCHQLSKEYYRRKK